MCFLIIFTKSSLHHILWHPGRICLRVNAVSSFHPGLNAGSPFYPGLNAGSSFYPDLFGINYIAPVYILQAKESHCPILRIPQAMTFFYMDVFVMFRFWEFRPLYTEGIRQSGPSEAVSLLWMPPTQLSALIPAAEGASMFSSFSSSTPPLYFI